MKDKNAVIEIIKSKKWTLSFAESCTGGLISSQLTESPGVSSFFKGAVVSYSNEVKAMTLNVSELDLKTVGAVSAPVALQMAQGAKHLMKTDISLSVTGIAGPDGGSVEKPVGLVFIAVVGPDFEKVERHVFTSSNGNTLSRREIQLATAQKAWELLHHSLKMM